MAKYEYLYKCNICFSTMTIVFDTERVGRKPNEQDLPDSIICGYRGCEGTCLNEYNDRKRY